MARDLDSAKTFLAAKIATLSFCASELPHFIKLHHFQLSIVNF